MDRCLTAVPEVLMPLPNRLNPKYRPSSSRALLKPGTLHVMYIYIYVHIHIYIYIYICMYTSAYIYIYTSASIHIHMHYVYTSTCRYLYICLYTYAYIHIYTYTYIHIHVYRYVCIHTYICIHIHIDTYVSLYIYLQTHTHTHTHPGTSLSRTLWKLRPLMSGDDERAACRGTGLHAAAVHRMAASSEGAPGIHGAPVWSTSREDPKSRSPNSGL